jgi:hypothetical protein
MTALDARRPAGLLTMPPGDYRRDFALELVDQGHERAAYLYLRAWLSRECDQRFAAATERLGAGR